MSFSRRIGDRRLNLLLAVLVWLGVASRASAQFSPPESAPLGDTDKVLTVSAEILPAAGDQPYRLRVVGQVAPGWHMYSITQPAGGPKRTRILLDESSAYKVKGPLVPSPAPTVKHYPKIWENLDVEEHEGQVSWTAPLEIAEGVNPATLVIAGHLKGQVCSDRCVEVDEPFEAKLPAASTQTAPNHAAPFKTAPAGAPLLNPPPPNIRPSSAPPFGLPTKSLPGAVIPTARRYAAAAPAGDLQFKSNFLTLTGRLDRAAVAPGSMVNLTLTAAPARGWHIYALGDRAPEDPGEGLPTIVAVTDHGPLEIGAPTSDKSIKEKKSPTNPSNSIHYYDGTANFNLPILVPADAKPGDYEVSGMFGFLTCSDDDKSCDRPEGTIFKVIVPVKTESQPGEIPVQFAASSYKQVAKAAAAGAPWGKVAAAAPTAAAESPSAAEGQEFSLSGLGLNLLLAFFGGLILNLMPCVLPVIGLKVMTFVEQAGESRRRVFMLNGWFTLGIVAVFLGMGAMVAFTNLGYSSQFQDPRFTIPLAGAVFVFALSLFGVWEIPVPGFIGSHAAHKIAEREGVVGAFSKGVLSTLLATPCVGPLMFVPISWTSKIDSKPLTLLIFGMMGVGMAAPYLVIGANPRLLRFLPKPGAWMETFKQLMGFVLLATVVWLFWTIPSGYFVASLALLFGLWLACWWIGRTPLTAELGDKLRAWGIGAIITAVVGLFSFHYLAESPPAEGSSVAQAHGVWRPFTPAALQELREQHVPVLVDFTAKWCFVCQTNKATSLHTKATEEYMREHGIVGLIADKTHDAPEIDRLLTELGNPKRVIPYYAVYPSDGRPPITYSNGILLQGRLLGMLEQAGQAPSSERASTTLATPTLSSAR